MPGDAATWTASGGSESATPMAQALATNPPPDRADVVVVGGGLAGLAAAVTLRAARRGRGAAGGAPPRGRPRADAARAVRRWPVRRARPEFITAGHQALRELAAGVWRAGRRCGRWGRAGSRLPARRASGGGWTPYGGRCPPIWRGWPSDCRRPRPVPTPRRAWRAPDAAALDHRSLGAWIDEQALGPVVAPTSTSGRQLDYGVEPGGLAPDVRPRRAHAAGVCRPARDPRVRGPRPAYGRDGGGPRRAAAPGHRRDGLRAGGPRGAGGLRPRRERG